MSSLLQWWPKLTVLLPAPPAFPGWVGRSSGVEREPRPLPGSLTVGQGLGPLRPGVLVNTLGASAYVQYGVTGTRFTLQPEKIENKQQIKYMK